MNSLKILALAAALFSTGALAAEAPAEQKPQVLKAVSDSGTSDTRFGVHLNTIYILTGTIRLGAEMSLSETASIGLTTQYMPKRNWSTSSIFNDIKVSRFGIGVDSTIMAFGKLNSRGVYISPSIGYTSVTAEVSSVEAKLNTPYIELSAGYQWVWSNFRLALGGGPVYYPNMGDIVVSDSFDGSETRVRSSDIIGLSLDTNIGFIF